MTLQSSGLIGFADINVELGKNSTDSITFNDGNVRGLLNKPSGVIGLADAYGKSNQNANYSGTFIPIDIADSAAFWGMGTVANSFIPATYNDYPIMGVFALGAGEPDEASCFILQGNTYNGPVPSQMKVGTLEWMPIVNAFGVAFRPGGVPHRAFYVASSYTQMLDAYLSANYEIRIGFQLM